MCVNVCECVCLSVCMHVCVHVCIHALFMHVSLHHYSSNHKNSVTVCVINFIPLHTAVHRGLWAGHICCQLLPHGGVGGDGLCTQHRVRESHMLVSAKQQEEQVA